MVLIGDALPHVPCGGNNEQSLSSYSKIVPQCLKHLQSTIPPACAETAVGPNPPWELAGYAARVMSVTQ